MSLFTPLAARAVAILEQMGQHANLIDRESKVPAPLDEPKAGEIPAAVVAVAICRAPRGGKEANLF